MNFSVAEQRTKHQEISELKKDRSVCNWSRLLLMYMYHQGLLNLEARSKIKNIVRTQNCL